MEVILGEVVSNKYLIAQIQTFTIDPTNKKTDSAKMNNN